jgi:uncharacterized protein YoxC
MDTATISGIVIATAGVLIIGMVVVIKAMVSDVLKELKEDVKAIRGEFHRLDKELAVIKKEHDSGYCKFHQVV